MWFIVTEEEFLALAEELRPWTELAMKIEVAPWIKDYVDDMDNLYSELTVECLQTNARRIGRTVKDYREIFEKSEFKFPSTNEKTYQPSARKLALPEKVRTEGDPGMGKTTLAKKMAWDWAQESFIRFSLVFFVCLKLVNPGDAIENAIIQQTPPLEGMGIPPGKILQILNRFGSRCLLILDGLDEHALGQNLDVMKIIEGRKFLHCNIFLTSRPHSVSGIKKYFNTRVSVNGFTREQAQIYAQKILGNAKQVQSVLNFNPTEYRQDIALHNCPILLSFMCLLVRHDEIDLASEAINAGEIYVRMVRCLYKKFLIRKGREFNQNNFVTDMRKIGKLALETLLSGKPLLKRSDVMNEVGMEAFEYGLLIGHEDFRLIADETADISVTFPHRSIQEFLGALYFILCLIEGVSVQSLLGDDPEKSLFFTNPLFFYFANWVACGSKDYFPTIQLKCDKARQILKLYILKHIDQVQLDLPRPENEDNFIKKFQVSKWILKKIRPLLKTKLRSITVSESEYSFHPCTTWGDFNIVLQGIDRSGPILETLMQLCASADRQVSLYVFSEEHKVSSIVRIELSAVLHEHVKSLYVLGSKPHLVTAEESIEDKIILERLCLGHISVPLASVLNRHAQNESLSRLTYLSVPAVEMPHTQFSAVGVNRHTKPIVGCLFEEMWPHLSHLALRDLTTESFKEFCRVIEQGKLKNLFELSLALKWYRAPGVDWLRPKFLPILKELTLHRFITSTDTSVRIATILQQKEWCLQKIDLSYSCGTRIDLSFLLELDFPELHTLILNQCGLNCKDLVSLVQANVEGRIPELKHLDISLNDKICGHLDVLFQDAPPPSWNNLQILNVERSIYRTDKKSKQVCSPDLYFLSEKTSSLQSLKELRVSAVNNRHMSMTSHWGGLATLHVVCLTYGDSGLF